jgi:hypothetical protein
MALADSGNSLAIVIPGRRPDGEKWPCQKVWVSVVRRQNSIRPRNHNVLTVKSELLPETRLMS